MAGKRKFRSVLSFTAKKSKKDRYKCIATRLVVLEEQKARYVRLKVTLNVKSDHKVAEGLLDT